MAKIIRKIFNIFLIINCVYAFADIKIGSNTYANIQAALNGAIAGETVLLGPATYTGAGNVALSWPNVNGITLKADPAQLATSQNVILDAQFITRHILVNQQISFNIESISFINGLVSTQNVSDDASEYGGSIYAGTSNVTINIKNCIFAKNNARYGGAIALGAKNIENCLFVSNNALTGGALFSGDNLITASIFINNYAESDGGVIANGFSTMNNCVLQSNSANFMGGAFSYGFNALINCQISGNRAAVYGGGFGLGDVNNLLLINCQVNNNNG